MSGLSEGELHVQAMRLVCEALAEREKTGLEVDWDVLLQMYDQMDAMLQALQHKHRYDSSEIVDLRKDRDAARAEIETLKGAMAADDKRLRDAEERIWPLRTLGRGAPDAMADEILHLRGAMAADDQRLRNAEERVWPGVTWGCDAPDKMADEIETLRQQLAEQQAETVDVRRQRNNETDRLNATNAVSVQQRDEIAYLRTRLDEERSVSARLRQQLDDAQRAVSDAFAELNSVRQQLDATNAAVTLQRAGIERLSDCIGKVRSVIDGIAPSTGKLCDIAEALAELDASTKPAPVAEPLDAEGGA